MGAAALGAGREASELLEVVKQPKCTTISLWGFTDRHTWLEEIGYVSPDPLPYDRQYQKKPAYFGILEALKGK